MTSSRDESFLDDEVMIGLGRDRRQVGHGEDLLVLTEFAQALADLLGHLTADAGVHFVEDRDDVLVGRLERERQAALDSTRPRSPVPGAVPPAARDSA